MTQSDQEDLISAIICLTSPDSNDQSRHNAEKFIMDSISEDFFRSLIELIKSDQIQGTEKDSVIIVFSTILKNLRLIEKIDNITSILIEVYILSIQLIFDSESISSSHLAAVLLNASINSLIFLTDQVSAKLELSFYQDLFKSLINSSTCSSSHGFCFAIGDLLYDYKITKFCNEDEVVSFINGVITILQNNYTIYGNEKKSDDYSKDDDQCLQTCYDILDLSKIIFEQDEICAFLKENQQIFQEFIQAIFNFFEFSDTFPNSMNCLASVVESDQTLLFPFLEHLISIITSYINENANNYASKQSYDSIFSICNFIDNLSNDFFFLFLELDLSPLIQLLCKIISNAPPNCDSYTDWEPHNVCQNALSNIVSEISQIVLFHENLPSNISDDDKEKLYLRLNAIISELFTYSENLLSSQNYNDRASSLVILGILIEHFGSSMFFPVKDQILQLLNDDIPRIRESSIFCLINFVSFLPNHRCKNDCEFAAISEIYAMVNTHINEFSMHASYENDPNDCISISHATFYLLYYISLIPGFDSLGELMNIIFFNLPFLLSNHSNSILKKILKMIRKTHFSIIESYSTIEQLLLFVLSKEDPSQQEIFSFLNCSNLEDLIPSIIDIIFEFCLRFGSGIAISEELVQNLIDFSISMQSCYSTYSLPLISFIFSKNLVDLQKFNDFIQPLCQFSFSLLQKNNEIYEHQDLKIFFQFSIHSILFFQNIINNDMLQEDLLELIFNLTFPFSLGFASKESMDSEENDEEEDNDVDDTRVTFDLQVYSVNLSLLIAQKIPELMTCNAEVLLKQTTSILNSYNFLKIGEMKREKLFKSVLESIKIIFAVFPVEILEANCPMLINNLFVLIITLKKQSALNQDKVIILLHYIAENFPVIMKNAIGHQLDDFKVFLYYFKSNKYMIGHIYEIAQLIQLNI